MFAPPRLKVPVPSLVSPPVPDSVPEKWLSPAPPVLSVWAPSATVPAPASVPIVWSPASASVPGAPTVTAAVAGSAAPWATRAPPFTVTMFEAIEPTTSSVPASTVVAPV